MVLEYVFALYHDYVSLYGSSGTKARDVHHKIILLISSFGFVRMVLESALGWYQGRISLYDKQSWETTVEQRILQGLSYTPRKTANPKTEFIDVDLVRGE